MKQKITIALFLAFATTVIFWACKDDDLPEPISGVTNKVTFTQFNLDTVSYRTAKLNATIDNAGKESITEHGVCYGTNANPTITDSKVQQGSLSGNTYICSINNLDPNTTYHVRAYLKFREITTYSSDVTLKTKELYAPVITTLEISNISYTSATSGGNITDKGGSDIIARGVCYSINSNPTIADSITADGTGTGSFVSELTELELNRTYYVRAYATNSMGTSYGEEKIFTTSDEIPLITTNSITNIEATTATSGGNITNDNGFAVTERGVCWSTETNPTIVNSKTSNGTGTGSFVSELTVLTPNTTYYIRAYATNEKGTAYGQVETFITPVAPIPILTTVAATNIEYSSATSGGNITSNEGYEVTVRGVCWSTSEMPDLTNCDGSTSDGTGTGEFASSIIQLNGSTTYYIRAYATNEIGTAYGQEETFTTPVAPIPILTTTEVTNIDYFTAISGGNISSDEGYAVTTRGICWSKIENPSLETNDGFTSNGSGLGEFFSSLTSLEVGTIYYVKAYATNEAGTAYGNQVTFSTTEGIVPEVVTTDIIDISYFTATGGGNVVAENGYPVTARGVCWSTLSNPTIENDASSNNGIGAGEFTSKLTNLIVNTTYYVRAYATNSIGTAYGNGIEFTTLAYGTVTDIDGNTYNTVTISTQGWMAENLKVTHYPNTTAIPLVTDNTTWANLGNNNTADAYCYYNNNANNEAATYGALYTYAAAKDACPTGWRLPTESDWSTLTTYLGGNHIAGGKLKETGTAHWTAPNTDATNETGFTALPGGNRGDSDGVYYFAGEQGRWWSSTESSSSIADWYIMFYGSSQVFLDGTYGYKSKGNSVRCVKD